jgi:hypothetical protein
MKVFLFSLFISSYCFAQMPETDIWLVNIVKKDGKYSYENPLNISNRKGYDNQPNFTEDNKGIYFVSDKVENQTDIFIYNIKHKTINPIFQTRESEYSPTLTTDNKFITCVVVLTDSSQQLHNYHIENKLPAVEISKGIPNTDSVGYFTWLNKDTVLYYKLTEPHSLRAWDITTNKDVWICDYPIRAFKKTGNTSQFIYGIKKDSTSVEFRIYNPMLRESKVYATYPSVAEDFIWNNELGLIKSENSDLLNYNPLTKNWDLLFSFSSIGIKKITRFVFDSKNKRLAIVSNL